jgi:hypothetical protein
MALRDKALPQGNVGMAGQDALKILRHKDLVERCAGGALDGQCEGHPAAACDHKHTEGPLRQAGGAEDKRPARQEWVYRR